MEQGEGTAQQSVPFLRTDRARVHDPVSIDEGLHLFSKYAESWMMPAMMSFRSVRRATSIAAAVPLCDVCGEVQEIIPAFRLEGEVVDR